MSKLPIAVSAVFGPSGTTVVIGDVAGDVSVRDVDTGALEARWHAHDDEVWRLAVDASGALFVVEALAGASGLYRVPESGAPELVLAGPNLIGVAFDRQGTLVVCSNETAYRLPVS